MAIPPRKIRQLPPALPAKGSDVFPVSQMDETGIASTRAMSRDQFQSDIIQVIAEARQEFVDTANAEHTQIREWLTDLEERIQNNEISDSNVETAIAMVQQMIAEGDGGKSAYQLWQELPGNSGKTIQQYFEAMTGPPGTTKWTGITEKPATFPPSEHTHPISDVVGAQAALDAKAPLSHTHNQGDIVGLNTALEAASAPTAWLDITGKPTSFPPDAHTHTIANVTGLQTALDNAAASPTQPTWSTLSGKPSTFPPSTHSHSISDVSGLQALLDSKKGLSLLGTATVGETTVLSLSLGVKRYSVTMTGAAVGDRIVATLTGAPQNGSLQDVYVSAANTVNVGVLTPALGIAQVVAVPLAVYKVV